MVKTKESAYIDDKMAAFCKNKEAYTINASKLSSQFRKDKILIKVYLSGDIVALMAMDSSKYQFALEGPDITPYLGFYCANSNKFFFVAGVESILLREGEDAKMPLHYNPLPFEEMDDALRKGMAERLAASIPTSNIDIFDEKTCWFAANEYFFSQGDFEPTPYCSFCSVMKKKDSEMSEVSKYLTNPEEWVRDTCEKIYAKKSALKKAKNEMASLTKLHIICKMIRETPDHPWNKAIRFVNAIKDKKTIIIRFKKGGETCDFRIRPSNLGGNNGKVPEPICFCKQPGVQCGLAEVCSNEPNPVICEGLPTGRTCKRVYEFLGNYFFKITDVDSVLYNGKVIYKD